MFQCSVSALMFVPFVMAIPSPLRVLRTWLRGGAAWLCSHYRFVTERAATSIPVLCHAGILLWSRYEESVRNSITTSHAVTELGLLFVSPGARYP